MRGEETRVLGIPSLGLRSMVLRMSQLAWVQMQTKQTRQISKPANLPDMKFLVSLDLAKIQSSSSLLSTACEDRILILQILTCYLEVQLISPFHCDTAIQLCICYSICSAVSRYSNALPERT